MSKHLSLFCLVDGEATSNAFPVSASTTATIGELKDLIKAKKVNDFRDVDADKLTLWHADYLVIAANNHHPVLLKSMEFATELDPMDDVADVFQAALPKRTIHIIVQRPPPGNANAPYFQLFAHKLSITQ